MTPQPAHQGNWFTRPSRRHLHIALALLLTGTVLLLAVLTDLFRESLIPDKNRPLIFIILFPAWMAWLRMAGNYRNHNPPDKPS
jgi:hypothetical protein